jgi:hypothetical protein
MYELDAFDDFDDFDSYDDFDDLEDFDLYDEDFEHAGIFRRMGAWVARQAQAGALALRIRMGRPGPRRGDPNPPAIIRRGPAFPVVPAPPGAPFGPVVNGYNRPGNYPARGSRDNAIEMMEDLGWEAAEAESDAEAEAFMGALLPLATQAIPGAARLLHRSAPTLLRAIATTTQALRRTPGATPLLRALPGVVLRTVSTITRQARQGRPVPQRAVLQTFTRQTARSLRSARR